MSSSVLSITTPDSNPVLSPSQEAIGFYIQFPTQTFHGSYIFLQIVEKCISQLTPVINDLSGKLLIGRIRVGVFLFSESRILPDDTDYAN